jgi:CHAT domain-containing protein
MQSLRLNSTIVTLNACTTGLNHVASGDELLGLPRAFLYAGAATIVCSLHEVDDVAAYILMARFFEYLGCGMSPSLALHHAQLSLRTLSLDEAAILLSHGLGGDEQSAREMLDTYGVTPFAHARYWAPFMVIGKP